MSLQLALIVAFCWCAACLSAFMIAGVIAQGMRHYRAEVDADALRRVVEEAAREETDRAVKATRQMAQNALQRSEEALERAERANNAVAARTLTRK